MINKHKYTPEDGGIVFSSEGCQYFNSIANQDFYYLSDIKRNIKIKNKFHFSECWETGDFYHIYNNIVYKRKHNGEILYQISLNNPVAISAIQYEYPIKNKIDEFRGIDKGCWIADKELKKIFKTDENLNILHEITINNPLYIIASVDNGCYVFDTIDEIIYKISNNGIIQSSLSFDIAFNNQINNEYEIIAIDVDIFNNLWIGTNDKITKINFNNILSLGGIYEILSMLNINGIITDFNIEKSLNNNFCYVCGSYNLNNMSWIAKMTLNGSIISSNLQLNVISPVKMNVSQWNESNEIYILSELIDYSSSSSSSS
jgi:hypothetical protein